MPWKKKGDQLDVDASGNPIWTDDKGADKPIDGGDLLGQITRLNGESRAHRIAKETAEANLTKFAGIDADAAKTAIEKMSLIDQSKLIDAGKVEELKQNIAKDYTRQIEAMKADNTKLADNLKAEKIGNKFASSQFIRDKLTLDGEMSKKLFGDRFDLDKDGNVIGKDANGNPLISSKNSGAIADFDEAFESVFSQYAGKDAITRGANHSGTGNNGNGGNQSGTKRVVTRSQELAMPVSEKAAFHKSVLAGTAELVDDPK